MVVVKTASKVKRGKRKQENTGSMSSVCAKHDVTVLKMENITPFLAEVEQNDHICVIIYISPKGNNKIGDNKYKEQFQKVFGDNEGLGVLLLDENKKIIKMELYSYETMDDELNETLEKWNVFEKDYCVIKK